MKKKNIMVYLSAKLGFGAADVTSSGSSSAAVVDTLGLLGRVLCRPNEGSII